MSQQQPHQNRGSFNNSANRPVSSSHNYNNNRQDGRSLAKTTTTNSRTSKSGNNTSPIAVVNTNFQMPLSNGPTILEKNHLYQQQQQQQLQQHEQFGNHVVNRQHYFQFIQQPQMSVQYSNTNVPFQNSANVQQHQQHTHQQQLQQHANIDNNVNNILLHNHNSSISSSGSVNENNMSPTTQSSSYFQSLPPEQFREMFLKKVFLGEDSSNFEVSKTTSSLSAAQTSPIAIDNNIQRVITNPSSPPQQNNNISPHALFPQPNVHNSPVTSPNSLLQMQQQNLLAPNHQHSLNQQQAMNVHNRNAIVNNNELLPSLPPQQLENLSEQQLMEYILTWMTSVKTTNQ